MEGKRFIRRIRLCNLLSYGAAEDQWLEMEPLNVLIGANGSGKSNLISAISLLKACPGELTTPLGPGGIQEWIWKGANAYPYAEIETDFDGPTDGSALRHSMNITGNERKIQFISESLSRVGPDGLSGQEVGDELYSVDGPMGEIFVRLDPGFFDDFGTNGGGLFPEYRLKKTPFKGDRSVLAQARERQLFPEITWLGEQLSKIKIYEVWGAAAYSTIRKPVGADLDPGFLMEDASNLALILEDLIARGLKTTIIERLQQFFEPVTDLTTTTIGGLIQFHLHERGLEKPIPSARLSDGTLHFLILLAILSHPEPPPLICIEEPEVGFHPDVIPMVGELLIEASQRTQLLVTTHSADLVSALGEVPEAVVVCERPFDDGTTLRRLAPEKMKKWLEEHTLGHVWAMGELGGNRW